jgi:acyl-CoA dehydrogenase
MNHIADTYQDIRDAVRDLCAQFPAEYFRQIDDERGYPEKFVTALTEAGWMAALIPQEYGGSGLGLLEASVIMEEINRCGGNSGACHGQMYNMVLKFKKIFTYLKSLKVNCVCNLWA